MPSFLAARSPPAAVPRRTVGHGPSFVITRLGLADEPRSHGARPSSADRIDLPPSAAPRRASPVGASIAPSSHVPFDPSLRGTSDTRATSVLRPIRFRVSDIRVPRSCPFSPIPRRAGLVPGRTFSYAHGAFARRCDPSHSVAADHRLRATSEIRTSRDGSGRRFHVCSQGASPSPPPRSAVGQFAPPLSIPAPPLARVGPGVILRITSPREAPAHPGSVDHRSVHPRRASLPARPSLPTPWIDGRRRHLRRSCLRCRLRRHRCARLRALGRPRTPFPCPSPTLLPETPPPSYQCTDNPIVTTDLSVADRHVSRRAIPHPV